MKTAPASLAVSYGSVAVGEGVRLTREQTADAPNVSIEADASHLYTLLMTDPDAPSHKDPRMADWLHWMVVNIPGSDLSSGEEVTSYNGPSPPPGTGPHRYIFTLYQQKGKIEVAPPAQRGKFDPKAFASAHHLEAAAGPIHFTTEAR